MVLREERIACAFLDFALQVVEEAYGLVVYFHYYGCLEMGECGDPLTEAMKVLYESIATRSKSG